MYLSLVSCNACVAITNNLHKDKRIMNWQPFMNNIHDMQYLFSYWLLKTVSVRVFAIRQFEYEAAELLSHN